MYIWRMLKVPLRRSSCSSGKSTADWAAEHGVYFTKANNDRINGWMQVHYRLAFDEQGYPMMYIFDTCKDFIRTLPLLCYDEHMPEDLDTDGEDHIADETRYFCMMNPLAAPRYKAPKVRTYSPLDLEDLDRLNEPTGESEFYLLG